MKRMRALLCLLLAALVLFSVCGALTTAFAAPETVTVTFALKDGRVIRSYTVPYGEMPEYTGPSHTRDDYFDYKLTGWTPELVPATKDATYYPVFERHLRTDDGAKSRLRGDANGNGKIEILDATVIQRYLVGLYDDPYGVIHVFAAIGGERVSILDATRIQRYLAGFENECGIGLDVLIPFVKPTEPASTPATEQPTEPATTPATELPTIRPDPPIAPTDPYELPPV